MAIQVPKPTPGIDGVASTVVAGTQDLHGLVPGRGTLTGVRAKGGVLNVIDIASILVLSRAPDDMPAMLDEDSALRSHFAADVRGLHEGITDHLGPLAFGTRRHAVRHAGMISTPMVRLLSGSTLLRRENVFWWAMSMASKAIRTMTTAGADMSQVIMLPIKLPSADGPSEIKLGRLVKQSR